MKKSILSILFLIVFVASAAAQAELVALGVLGLVSLIKSSSQKNAQEKNIKYTALLNQAKQQTEEGNHIAAVKTYQDAIALEPNNSKAYQLRGTIYMLYANQYDNAIADFSKAIHLDEKDAESFVHRGVVYYFQQNYAKALENYDQALELDNTNAKVYYYKGNAFYNLKEYDKALFHYNKAIDHNYRNALLFYNKGNVLIEKMQDNLASVAYRDAISLGLKLNKEIYKDHIRTADNFIQRRVEQQISDWQQKGEFEKTVDYKIRVNEITRNEKAKNFALTYKKEWEKLFRTLFLENKNEYKIVGKYDADNETFLIEHPFIGQIPVKVSVSDAQYFKNNFEQMNVSEFDILPLKDTVVISKFKIGEKYFYDNQQAITYASTDIQYNFKPITYESNTSHKQVVNNYTLSKNNIQIGIDSVDIDIPETKTNNEYTYALIIGNEDYSTFQVSLSREVNVDFAVNDASIFKLYANKTLGVPEKQMKFLKNATAGQMKQGIAWLAQMQKFENGKAKILVYYSGHGLPDETTKEGYLLPVDISADHLQDGISLKYLYEQLNAYPTEKTLVIFDACFSGGSKSIAPILARKGVRIAPKLDAPMGNMLVLSSSSKEESSGVFNEKQHGFFTYFLLKHLQETKGNTSMSNLYETMKQKVLKESSLMSKPQTPSLQVSPAFETEESWNWNLRRF